VIEIKATVGGLEVGILETGGGMARLLKALEANIDTRFALYRRMRAKAGVARIENAGQDSSADIRAALLACADCQDTGCCQGWLDQGRAGIPAFCRARSAFAGIASAAQ